MEIIQKESQLIIIPLAVFYFMFFLAEGGGRARKAQHKGQARQFTDEDDLEREVATIQRRNDSDSDSDSDDSSDSDGEKVRRSIAAHAAHARVHNEVCGHRLMSEQYMNTDDEEGAHHRDGEPQPRQQDGAAHQGLGPLDQRQARAVAAREVIPIGRR